MSQLSARYLHNSGTLSRCGRAPDPAPSLGRHDMTPGGLRHQLPRHSNPSENANEICTLNKWTTPPPKGRCPDLGEAKPRVSNPLPPKEQASKRNPGPNLLPVHLLFWGLCLQKLPCTVVIMAPKQERVRVFVFKRWPALTCQNVVPLEMMLKRGGEQVEW